MGGLAKAVMAVLSLYRTVAGMVSKAKTVTMGSAGAGTRSGRHAEIERLPEGRRPVDERRLAA